MPRLTPLITLLLGACAATVSAGDFTYKAPAVSDPLFAGDDVALLETEREKLASNIAGFVSNSLSPRPHAREVENGRRFLALALHLHPRDRNALVANAQLTRGLIPKKVEVDYQPAVLAKLLLERARTLLAKSSSLDQALGGYFLYVAMESDPDNEDAVYEYEIYRIDHGEVDWGLLTDGKKTSKPSAD